MRKCAFQGIPTLSESYLVNKSGILAPKDASLVPESMFWKMSLDLEMRQFFANNEQIKRSETSPWVGPKDENSQTGFG